MTLKRIGLILHYCLPQQDKLDGSRIYNLPTLFIQLFLIFVKSNVGNKTGEKGNQFLFESGRVMISVFSEELENVFIGGIENSFI